MDKLFYSSVEHKYIFTCMLDAGEKVQKFMILFGYLNLIN